MNNKSVVQIVRDAFDALAKGRVGPSATMTETVKALDRELGVKEEDPGDPPPATLVKDRNTTTPATEPKSGREKKGN